MKVGENVNVRVGADGVLVGVSGDLRLVVAAGSAAISSTTVRRTRGGLLTGSALPPQATSSTTVVERGSCRILLSFTTPYYSKCLLNG